MWYVSPVLGVSRVRKTAEYYRDVLGFTLAPDGVFQPSADEPDGVYAIVKRSGVWIHLQIRRTQSPPRERGAHERDVYIYVADVDGLYAELVGRGASVWAPPEMTPHGIREIVVEDIEGYRLSFGELPATVTRE